MRDMVLLLWKWIKDTTSTRGRRKAFWTNSTEMGNSNIPSELLNFCSLPQKSYLVSMIQVFVFSFTEKEIIIIRASEINTDKSFDITL